MSANVSKMLTKFVFKHYLD